MADEKTVNKIMTEYERLREKAAVERKNRIALVYKSLPRVKEIDAEITRRGGENVKNIFEHPERKDEFNADFKSNLNRLTDEKNKLLLENGIDIDFDKYKYECEICGDTGYDEDGNKCVCFKQKLINEAYAVSNMDKMVTEQNFDTFDIDYYSDADKNGISPRENILKILSGCKRYCENFDSEDKSLLFYGGVGLGKTFMSCAVAKDVMDKGKTVLYIRASRLFTMYDDYRYGRSSDRDFLDNVYGCDLLIIDDLGTEMNGANNSSVLFDIVNERMSRGKKMIINTNLGLGELEKEYTPRFTSRLYENFYIYKFVGDDIRLQKLKKR